MQHPHDNPGFSLVELLAVMAIGTVLLGLGIVGFSSMITSTDLTRAGEMISSSIGLARQEAVTKNQEVQIRFYKMTDGASHRKGIQVWRVDETNNGPRAVPVTPIQQLPGSIVIVDDVKLSPLLGADPFLSSQNETPGYSGLPYTGFRFRSGGSAAQGITPANNFLTAQRSSDPAGTAKNYCTIQVNPVTGRVSTFRP